MNSCEFCNSPLGEKETREGKCSHCGNTIQSSGTVPETTPEPPGSGTVSSRDIMKTVESESLASITPEDASEKNDSSPSPVNQTADSSSFPAVPQDQAGPDDTKATHGRIDQTIESSTIDPPKPPPKTGTVANQAMQTMDAASLPSEMKTHINETWGAAAEAESNPRMTLRTPSRSQESGSTLVVQQRALRSSTSGDSGNADYELLDKLGEGGMGYVFLARQAAINRIVALKMLKADTSSDMEQRHKFLAEAVVTGDLDHPNIVPIYDLGTNEDGALFYSMKRVQGTPWIDVLKDKTLHDNLEILMKVADAVAFAHARKVVHRDLKPENVMLGEFGEVLLLDWGLALPTSGFEKSQSVTQTSAMGGTPAYMAPEMATGPLKQVGTASDIYLLGAILYEIVTGSPPHAGDNVVKCLTAAAKNVIQPTDKEGELVNIARRAMQSRQQDRHASVLEFQDDIRAYMSHTESIALSTRAEEQLEQAHGTDDYQDCARALFAFQEAFALWGGNKRAQGGIIEASRVYAASAERKGDLDLGVSLLDPDEPKHAPLLADIREAQRERDLRQQRLRRLRRLTRVGILVFLLVVTGASIWIWIEKEHSRAAEKVAKYQRGVALEQKKVAEEAKDEAEVARAVAQDARDEAVDARNVAEDERTKAVAAKQEADTQREQAVAARKDAEVQREQAVVAKQEADRQRDRAEYEAYVALIGLAAARIDENAFGTAKQLLDQCPPNLRHWEWRRLRHMCHLSVADMRGSSPMESIDFTRNGNFVTGGWNGLAEIWDGETGKILHTLRHGELTFVHAVAFSPDGQWVATGSDDARGGLLRIWDAHSGETVRTLKGHTDAVVSLAFSGDGKRLLSGSFDRTAKWWDVRSGKLLGDYLGHRGWVWDAAFCYRHDGDGNALPEERMVTASQDGFAIVWQLDTGEMSPPFRGHSGPIYAAAFSPDGQFVATGGHDKRVLLWKPEDLREFDYETVVRNATRPEGSDAEPTTNAATEIRSLSAHQGAVRDVAFDSEGTRIVSGGHDNTVRVWDASTGKPLKTLRGHNSWVQACAFAPDDQSIVSVSYDRFVKRWELDRYEEVRRVPQGRILEGHSGDILAAEFSRDAKYVVTASRDRTARKWDVRNSKELVRFEEGHSFLTSSAQFFPKRKWLATAALDNTTRIWDLTTGTEIAILDRTGRSAALAISSDGKWLLTGSEGTSAQLWELTRRKSDEGDWVYTGVLRQNLRGHKAIVNAVAFSPDDQLLFTGDGNGTGILWDASDKGHPRRLRDIRGHTARLTACAFLPNGERLITASADGTVAQWTVATGEERSDLILRHTRGETISSLALTPEGKTLVTACNDGKVRVWDLESAKVLQTLTPENPVRDRNGTPVGRIRAVAVDPAGNRVLTINSEARVARLWDLATGEEIAAEAETNEAPRPYLDFRRRGHIWSALYSPDGDQIVTVGGDSARLWNVENDTPPEKETQVFIPHGSVACAAFSADGQHIITSSWDNSVRIWNAQTGKGELKLEGHTGSVNSAEFSTDGKWALTASSDKTARLWDTKTGETLRIFNGHTAAVHSAHFSPNMKQIVTASRDATARVWDVETGETLQILAGHRYGVRCAVFSSDASRVLTGGEDQTAKVWDIASGIVLLELRGHTAAVTSVAFSPGDQRALTGSDDHSAKLWDTDRIRKTPSEKPDATPQEGQEILELRGHEREVTSVSFSVDGRLVLTASRDGTAIIWLAESD